MIYSEKVKEQMYGENSDYVHVDRCAELALENGWVTIDDLLHGASEIFDYITGLDAKTLKQLVEKLNSIDLDELIKEKTDKDAVEEL